MYFLFIKAKAWIKWAQNNIKFDNEKEVKTPAKINTCTRK